MNVLISNPADCEVRGVIRFLQAENVRPCEIHQTCCGLWWTCYERGQCPKMVYNVYEWANRCSWRWEVRATLCHHRCIEGKGEPHHSRESTFHNKRSVRKMSGSVSCTCVPNCHQTFAIPQNLCTFGQAAVWYEEGISKLVSRHDKCLNVQGDYVEK